MTSTDLIAQANRHYAEMVEGRIPWFTKSAWTAGYIEGWMDGRRDGIKTTLEAARKGTK